MSIGRFVFTSHQKHSELQKMRRLKGTSDYAESVAVTSASVDMEFVEMRRRAEALKEDREFNEEWDLLQ